MKFRLGIEWLESRENPSGPTLVDPTAPLGSGDTTTTTTTSTDTTITVVIDPSLITVNPWGS